MPQPLAHAYRRALRHAAGPWRRCLWGRPPVAISLLLGGLLGLLTLLGSLPAWAQPSSAPIANTPSTLTLTLAQSYHPGVPLQDYWVSEKYDGIRAHWDGQRLISRQGLPIDAPAWFTQGWPSTALEGELWAGRGQFAAVQTTVAQGAKADADWRQLRLMVFDLPGHPGPFTERHAALQRTVTQLGLPWVQAAAQWQVSSHAQLQQQLRALTQAGGEGLMLRHASAPYRAGRSSDLLKLKMHEDAEATVIAHLPGKGKYQGMTGALLVQMPNGQRFKLGSGLSDAERAAPPAIGSTVTYRFNGLHPSGLPRFARYWRQRAESHAAPQP